MTDESIILGDHEVRVEDLTPQQKYLLDQITDLHKKAEALRFQLDPVEVARSAFTNMLTESLLAQKSQELKDAGAAE